MGHKIVFQGDSITDFGRSKEPAVPANTSLGCGYVFLTMNALRGREPEKNWQVYNRGTGGDTVVDLYARWKRDALNLQPNILSILIGINDTWHEYPDHDGVEVPRYQEFYHRLLSWTRATLPDTKLVLLAPFALPFGGIEAAWLSEIAQRGRIVQDLAAEFGAVFIPMPEILDRALKRAPQEYWLRDGAHPTPAGHQLISDAWLQATQEIRDRL